MNFFQRMWHDITQFFTEHEKEVLTFIESLAHSILVSGGQILMDLARQAVTDAENIGGKGESKFAYAQDFILGELEKRGIPIAVNAINGAIEAAVAEARAK